METAIGVSQDTVLGLKLFLMYINGLLNLNIDGKMIRFVYGTVLLFNDNSIDELYGKANESLLLVKKIITRYS